MAGRTCRENQREAREVPVPRKLKASFCSSGSWFPGEPHESEPAGAYHSAGSQSGYPESVLRGLASNGT